MFRLFIFLLVSTNCLLLSHEAKAEQVRTSYVSIPVSYQQKNWGLAGKLNVPLGGKNTAAVLIVHGSSGVDSRGQLHTSSLNKKGFTTLEIDLWAARGWVGKQRGRPANVAETLPDTFAALNYLQHLDGIDRDKIGILGFSWGGVVSMLVRNEFNQYQFGYGHGFAANVAFYPVCWVYNKVPGYELENLVNRPLLIQTGADDDYDLASSCDEWRQSLDDTAKSQVEITVYKDAGHAFNTNAAPIEVTDPFSHLGMGGQVIMKSNAQARAKSDQATVDFFAENLAGQ
jgi:dienelactone hydrolase